MTDDYGHNNDDHADYNDCASHNNEDCIPEMFLEHVLVSICLDFD